MKKKLIIVGLIQFGYNTDSFKYCEYLADEYDITYIGFEEDRERIIKLGVDVIYVKRNNRLLRKLRLLLSVFSSALKQKDAIIFCAYFRLVSLLSIALPFRNIFLDYRTGSVSPNMFKNWFKNCNMKVDSLFFRNISVITEDLKKHLKLPKKTKILPLGSDSISFTNKSFESIKMLYVGTLTGRQIEKTIFGVSEFLEKYPEVSVEYFIAGGGDNSLIKKKIAKYNLHNEVKLLGFVPNDEIVQYYDNCNLGICYAPVTKYYLHQPFTKLYEYYMSGMPVISVKLLDSVRRINNENGVLCDDNEQSFSDAIEKIYLNRNSYNSQQIRESVKDFSWENISKNIFKKIIDE